MLDVMMKSIVLKMLALQTIVMQIAMVACILQWIVNVMMASLAQETFAAVMVANMNLWTLNVTMDLHALKIPAPQLMKMPMKMDVYLPLILPSVMTTLSALLMLALLPLKAQMKMDVFTDQLIQDVMMDSPAPEMPATQNQKMQWMDALMKSWTLNVIMDLHALKMLAPQLTKMRMKMDV